MEHSPRSRSALVRRLRSTAAGELVSCVVLPLVFFWFADLTVSVANIAGAAVMVLLLVQGATYWLVKARQLTVPSARPAGMGTFSVLAFVNPVLLVVTIMIIGYSFVTIGPAAAVLGFGCWSLAVLEHVNYFHRQLMYDNAVDLAWLRAHGLKRAALARDLDRFRRTRSVRPGSPR